MPEKSKKWAAKPDHGRDGTIQRLVKAQAK
jgi:hypothetical protein